MSIQKVYEFGIFNDGLVFGSLEWGVLQKMEITLYGLIWDSVFSIMDLAMSDFALCEV